MRAFSLIETLMYIGLFALIMEGAFTGIFEISESADRNQARAYMEAEGEFITTKILYEISRSTSAHFSNASRAEIDLTSDSGISVVMKDSGGAFSISRNEGADAPFSSNLVQVARASFKATDISFTLQTRAADGRLLSEDFSSALLPHP